jgi:hypothetical protein
MGVFMEQAKKAALLLVASVVGFAYWIMILIPSIVEFFANLRLGGIQIDFFEGFSNIIKSGEIKWLLPFLFIIAAIIAPSVLNLIGWKKNNKVMVIIAIVLYLLSLNALSLLLCVVGILWDNSDDSSIQGKEKSPLFVIAGIFGILGLAFWLVPLMSRTDGTGIDSLFSAMLSGVKNTDTLPAFKAIGLNYTITLLLSFVLAIAISFFGRLRNNAKKALIAAILYIISLSIPSAILCFIGFANLKKQK